jgi:hypothetical protein
MKIVHRAELCGAERRQRIPLQLQHDSYRVHVILHSRERPRSSPLSHYPIAGDSRRIGVERSGQVFLLVSKSVGKLIFYSTICLLHFVLWAQYMLIHTCIADVPYNFYSSYLLQYVG